jgi:hypothetical protein
MNKMTAGRGISGSGAASAILGFFLPWVLVSCMGEPVMPMSGYEIASGTFSTVWGPSSNAYSSSNSSIPGIPMLYITLGAAVIAFLFFLVSYFIHKTSLTLSILQILVGIIGVIPFFLTIALLKNQYTQGEIPFGFNYQYGFWITIVGFAGIIIGGLLSIAESIWKPKSNATVEHPPDMTIQLIRLVELHKDGALSDEEFESAKKRLLS